MELLMTEPTDVEFEVVKGPDLPVTEKTLQEHIDRLYPPTRAELIFRRGGELFSQGASLVVGIGLMGGICWLAGKVVLLIASPLIDRVFGP